MQLNHLFKERLAKRWQRYLKYLRYVFNDHAVLALFILAGAAALAYRSIWQTAPVNWGTKSLLVMIVLLTFFLFKNPTNFLKSADPTTLLGDESVLRKLIKQATIYSICVNGLIECLLVMLLWPMMLRLWTKSLLLIMIYTIVLVILKMMLTDRIARMQQQFANQQTSKLVNWRQLMLAEDNHQFIVLSFFNLFVDVPGIAPRVKRQAWADTIINHWPDKQQNGMTKLFVTAFIRQTQYLKLWLRLTIIGGFAAWLTSGWLQTILLLILFYLLVLQLLPLNDVHQHIVFNFLYPITSLERVRAFQQAVLPWLIMTELFWILVSFIAHPSINLLMQNIICLVVVGGFLVFWYTKQKINKNTQRRKTRAFKK